MNESNIKSINTSIEFDKKVDLLFDELTERTEMVCFGNGCTGNACLEN